MFTVPTAEGKQLLYNCQGEGGSICICDCSVRLTECYKLSGQVSFGLEWK